jgi:hypothetical protein
MRGLLSGVRVSCRVSIALALCLAMAGSLGVSSRPASTKDRDRVVRLTRSGSFRFDSPDAVPHSHEQTQPDAAFSSLVVGPPQSATATSVAPVAPGAVVAAVIRTIDALACPGGSSTLGYPSSLEPGASPPSARPPGRAPPFST